MTQSNFKQALCRLAVVGVVALMASQATAIEAPHADNRPNIVFILTDDQDTVMGSSARDIMPKTHALLGDQGISLTNVFATTPVCCPSRSSFVTSRLLHNIHMTNNSLAGNCSSVEWQQTAEKDTFVTHLQDSGYRTGYHGKYLNQYGFPDAGGVEHIPPGWTSWYTLVGNSRYYNLTLSVNGTAEKHGDTYAKDYLPDLLLNETLRFISVDRPEPFFAVVATPSCHDPTEPAPQFANKFAGRKSPRLPNYGKGFSSDRNWFVRTYGADMTSERQATSDWQYMRRLETLQSVDDIVERVYDQLAAIGKLNNTYIFFTSDHGYHFFLLGLEKDKRMPYEFDIRVPGFVRGPGIQPGSTSDAVVTMIDFGPTFLDIAGVPTPANFDGKSALPILRKDVSNAAARSFFIEYHGEKTSFPGPVCKGAWSEGTCGYIEGPEMAILPPIFMGATVCSMQDATNNTYSCVRTLNSTHNTQFCKYSYGFQEYYDLNTDFWQRKNLIGTLSADELASYEDLWTRLSQCSGESCIISYETSPVQNTDPLPDPFAIRAE